MIGTTNIFSVRRKMGIRLIAISLLILLAASHAAAQDLLVGPEEGFRTITAAIEAAKHGDTIRVLGGTYHENLLVDKTLTLVGVDRPIIKGTAKGSVITITADGCAVRGFTIENSGGDLQAEDAGVLVRSGGNTVEQNELRDVLFGIYLFHAADNRILQNNIVGRTELESGERGAGLHLWNSPGNIIEDNVISFARDGMYIQNCAGNRIRRNRVSNLRYGLHFMNSDANVFEDNVFFDNVAGAAIMYSQNIELRRNVFVHNRGFSSFGILFQDCRQCVTEDNLILDNAVGLFLEASKGSVFHGNTIAENDVAMQIFSSSQQDKFSGNNFINNLSPLQVVGKSGSTQWQTSGGGNYWSDYDGYDMDGDGVGDVPHRIHNVFEYLEGNYPRLRIYLNSPAAQSIVAAERSFPIVKGSNDYDRQPLMRPVKTTASFARQESGGYAKWILLTLSCAMLGFSVLVFKRGFTG